MAITHDPGYVGFNNEYAEVIGGVDDMFTMELDAALDDLVNRSVIISDYMPEVDMPDYDISDTHAVVTGGMGQHEYKSMHISEPNPHVNHVGDLKPIADLNTSFIVSVESASPSLTPDSAASYHVGSANIKATPPTDTGSLTAFDDTNSSNMIVEVEDSGDAQGAKRSTINNNANNTDSDMIVVSDTEPIIPLVNTKQNKRNPPGGGAEANVDQKQPTTPRATIPKATFDGDVKGVLEKYFNLTREKI